MIETELKITLDDAGAARLRRHPALAGLRVAPRRTETLVSIYHDTPGHALAAAGIALRVRKIGRRWVQTIKRTGGSRESGLHSNIEVETAAPGGRLVLNGPDPDGVLAAIGAAAAGLELAPVFETRVRRIAERLRAPGGAVVELAIDRGEVVAGAARAPILEAELELIEGEVADVFDLARVLFVEGPIRFAASNKSARGYRLARTGAAEAPPGPRNAGALDYPGTATVETVARDVLRDCFAQIAGNVVVVLDGTAPEGPHQLRVGLRRLRTAFAVFAPILGEAALAPLSDAARRLGQVVGGLRDVDVLIDEVVGGAADLGLDPAARSALTAVLETRRRAVRDAVRGMLAGSETTGFLFDLARFIETRGWLVASDISQTLRLAAPIGDLAPGILDKRRRKVRKMARDLTGLEAEGLHELRKELKKLRYAADTLAPIYPGRKVAGYIRSLKHMQDTFGSLNDAAMAESYLTGDQAPGRGDPACQRGVGWVLGTLAVRVGADRPLLEARWQKLAAAKVFWR